MKKLYLHQQEFINKNPNKALLCFEAGTGKTITAISWLKLRPQLKALIIAPKGVQLMWRTELKEWNCKADVVTTDEIKKIDLNSYKAVVVDEAQNLCAPLFSKQRSQRATVMYNFVKKNPDAHILLTTATPIRSHPENLHTLACYLGIYWDIKKFREKFCHLTDKFGIFHLEPNKTWRKDIRPYLESISEIVNMRDCIDVPVHEHSVVNIKWTKKQEEQLKQEYMEPAKEWHTRHRLEQGEEKFKELQKILDGHRKVVVVCYYLEQIEDYKNRIGQDREVFVLTGSTKDQGQVFKETNEADDAILLIQAGLGAGVDLDKFSIMVFASMSFAFVHLVQMQARINRIHNLHKNQYIYLLGGRCDRDVKKQLDLGMDFHPPAYYNNRNANPEHTDDYVTSAPATEEETGGGSDSKGSRIFQGEPF
jgi:hypothetical protein